MNERARWRHRRIVMVCVAAIALGGAGWWGYQQFAHWVTIYYGIEKVELSYNDVFDDRLVEDVDTWMSDKKETGQLQTKSRKVLANELLQAFPLIRNVSWATYIPGYLHCTVTGVQPTFHINNKHVAGNNGKLYDKQDFCNYPHEIPELHISSHWLTKAVFGGVHQFFAELPKGLLTTYHIYYHDPYTIAMVPVDTELPHRCVCMVDEKSASRVRTMDELMALSVDLKERLQPKKEAISYFDFRFADRIISKAIGRGEFIQLQRVR